MKVSAPDGVKVSTSRRSSEQHVQQIPVPLPSPFILRGPAYSVGVLTSLMHAIGCLLQVYNVTSGKSLPQWLSETKKRSLRKDDEYTRRLELLQDFAFPSSCQRIKITPDQQYIFATGYHPPMVRHGIFCTVGMLCKCCSLSGMAARATVTAIGSSSSTRRRWQQWGSSSKDGGSKASWGTTALAATAAINEQHLQQHSHSKVVSPTARGPIVSGNGRTGQQHSTCQFCFCSGGI